VNAAVLCAIGLAVFALGYRFYSKLLAGRVLGLRDDEPVPSIEHEDGVDYVPTQRHVLFGHHYASIAGAAPIIGPAVALVWGWAPAFLWVVFGVVFMGAMHDFATLVMSMRHGGKSVGTIAASVLGPRTRALFLLVIFALILIVIAVFAKAIAGLFIAQPGTVIPINFEIVVALAIGWLCYKRKAKMLWPSIAALLALYAMVWVGIQAPLSFDTLVCDAAMTAPACKSRQMTTWVVVLLAYSFVASVLPVWTLLQPRDYINSHQLMVGLGALLLGIFVGRPVMSAPAFNAPSGEVPPLFPILFVTIACGAISGFHGLVSSGTTSKQVQRASDARPIGYGAMLGEGLLALIATLAVGAGLGGFAEHYDHMPNAAQGVGLFVKGAANFLVPLGIPTAPAQVLVAVMVISFAATSLDTGVRIQRFIIEELGSIYRIELLANRYVGGLLAVVLPLALFLAGKEGTLWPLFGAANQMLAGLSLVVVSVWLYRMGRPWAYAAIPMAIVLFIAAAALVVKVQEFYAKQNYLLVAVGVMLLVLESWIALEGLAAVRRGREPAAAEA
jgi:carbon starvation protein